MLTDWDHAWDGCLGVVALANEDWPIGNCLSICHYLQGPSKNLCLSGLTLMVSDHVWPWPCPAVSSMFCILNNTHIIGVGERGQDVGHFGVDESKLGSWTKKEKADSWGCSLGFKRTLVVMRIVEGTRNWGDGSKPRWANCSFENVQIRLDLLFPQTKSAQLITYMLITPF